MRYVLDTNVVSALMKGNASIVAHLQMKVRGDVCVPQPVVAEIEYGIQRLPRSKRREVLSARLELVRSEVQRCQWTDEVSEAFGKIKSHLERKGAQVEDFDAAVAAHALALQGVLVTANRRHMVRVPGLEVEDWSQPVPA